MTPIIVAPLAKRYETLKTGYAKHGFGWDLYDGRVETTFVFADPKCTDSLGWVRGHVPEGYLFEAYRLTLVAAQAQRVAA